MPHDRSVAKSTDQGRTLDHHKAGTLYRGDVDIGEAQHGIERFIRSNDVLGADAPERN